MKKTLLFCSVSLFCTSISAQTGNGGTTGIPAVPSCERPASGREISLIADPGFERGAFLIAPPEGKRVVERVLDFGYVPDPARPPVWDIAQWSSRYSLKDSRLKRSRNGDRGYADASKSITVNPDGSFSLELNGRREYGNTPRKAGEPWPHLYISQPVYEREEARIPLAECERLRFTLEGRLDFCKNHMDGSFDPGLHTIHVVLTLTVQVRNPDSPFHGKYLNLQLPVYDYRYDFPPANYAMDSGKPTTTGMFIYSESGEKVWDGPFGDRRWHRADLDILPILRAGIDRWTQAGGAFERVDRNDLYLCDFIMGWECEGTFHASMSFRNLSLTAYKK